MKRIRNLILVLIGLLMAGSNYSFAANNSETVYLKNGSVIKCTVLEQTPEETIIVQTEDGNTFVFKLSEVNKITKNSKGNRLPSNVGKYSLTSGYRGFFEFGYVVGVGSYAIDRVSFLTSHGYQFNPYFYLGAGFGLNYYHSMQAYSVPVFGHLRGTFINGRITPYVDLKIGYSIADIQGFYMNPSAGCRFGLTKKLGLNLGIGYEMQKTEMFFFSPFTSFYSTENMGGVTFKVGLDF